MAPSIFDLPAELRNRIYGYCLEINYDVYGGSHEKSPRFWSQPPKSLHLFLICKQIHQEAGSLLYVNYFKKFEYTARDIYDLNDLCVKIPQEHRRNFRAVLKVTLPDLSTYLERIGLHTNLPWTTAVTAQDGQGYAVRRTLRGDCFQAVRYRYRFGGRLGPQGYDRLSLYGHLGRLEWVPDVDFPKIRFRPVGYG
jgi:hypothetical protein